MPTQKLYVVGPNLRDQSKGSFHVHDEGCRDMYRMAARDPEFRSELENGGAVEFDTLTEVVDYIYPPEDFECESGEYMTDFHFAPCVKLPVERRTVAAIMSDLLEVLWYHEGAMDEHAERIHALEAEARAYIKGAS